MCGETVSCSDPTKFKPNSDSMHIFDEINRDGYPNDCKG